MPNLDKPELRDCKLRDLAIDRIFPSSMPQFVNYLSVLKHSVYTNIFSYKEHEFYD